MPNLNARGREARFVEIAPLFDYEHLHPDLRAFSQQCYDLAANMLHDLPDSEELYQGLRKLLEAKDCFVRASVMILDKADEAELRAAQQADELQEQRKDSIVQQSADVQQYFDTEEPDEPVDA